MTAHIGQSLHNVVDTFFNDGKVTATMHLYFMLIIIDTLNFIGIL